MACVINSRREDYAFIMNCIKQVIDFSLKPFLVTK